MIVPEPVLVPPQRFTLPPPPDGDVDAAREMARALRRAADQVEAAQRRAHRVLEDAHRSWTGQSARAAHHPLQLLDTQTRVVAHSLRSSADRMDDYARALERARHQHHWSLKKIAVVASVVVLTGAVVVATVGLAAPAAAAADAAIVGSEIAAATSAASLAGTAALEAAEAITLAVRALRALQAAARFIRPVVGQAAVMTDLRAYQQVRDVGTLDAVGLAGGFGREVLVGGIGGRLDGVLGAVGADTASPLLRWLAPTVAKAGGQAGLSVADQAVFDQQVSGWAVVDAASGSVRDSLVDLDSRTHVGVTAGDTFGPRPPDRVPDKVGGVLAWLDRHRGAPPPGYAGGRVFRNDDELLPPGRYLEYDVDARPTPGTGRNAERIVIDQDNGRVYYTATHYEGGFRRVR